MAGPWATGHDFHVLESFLTVNSVSTHENAGTAAAGPQVSYGPGVTPVTATARQMHALHAEKPKYVLGAFGGNKGKARRRPPLLEWVSECKEAVAYTTIIRVGRSGSPPGPLIPPTRTVW